MAVTPLPDPLTDDDQDAVAANIRALMGRYRVSQQRLANAVELDASTLSRKLAGKRDFTVREVGRIARYFHQPLGSLMARMDRSEDGFLDVTRNEHPLYVQESLFSGYWEGAGSITAGHRRLEGDQAGVAHVAHKEAA